MPRGQCRSTRWLVITLFAFAAYGGNGCRQESPTPSGIDAGVVQDAGDAQSGGGGGSRPVCQADTPCFGRLAQCVGAKQYQPYRDVGCHELCGERPCSGGACLPSGDIVDCPSGEQCRELPTSSGQRSAQCVPFDDAGVCGDEDLDGGDVPGCMAAWGCGDGRVDTYHAEGCDDANRLDGDGCDRNCKREDGFECPLGGGPCARLQFGDSACASDACRQGPSCVELASGLSCVCPEQSPAECGVLSLQSLPMPDDCNRFAVQALSRDGRVVGGKVGRSDMVVGGSVIWARDLGTHRLPVEDWFNIGVVALSSQGSVQLLNENTALVDQSARGVLLQDDQFIELQNLPDGEFADLDDSGRVLVGSRTAPPFMQEHAFRYADGELLDLGVLDASACPEPVCEPRSSHAAAISGDGSVVVGSAAGAAFRWSAASGMRRLEVVNAEATSSATSRAIDVSSDGSYVLGWSSAIPTPSSGVVRWNGEGEVESIPVPATEDPVHGVEPLAISADGRVIVGSLHFAAGITASAFIWDDVRGARELKDALSSEPSSAGWHFDTAVAVSADGSVVAGNGSYRGRPVAYVARVAPPP